MKTKDDLIMQLLREAREKGQRAISTDVISYATGMHRRDVHERMDALEKRGEVKRRPSCKLSFWGTD